MTSLLDKLKEENKITNELQSKVKMQEIEIRTLIDCVENMRQSLVDKTDKSQINPEFQKYMDNSSKMIE